MLDPPLHPLLDRSSFSVATCIVSWSPGDVTVFSLYLKVAHASLQCGHSDCLLISFVVPPSWWGLKWAMNWIHCVHCTVAILGEVSGHLFAMGGLPRGPVVGLVTVLRYCNFQNASFLGHLLVLYYKISLFGRIAQSLIKEVKQRLTLDLTHIF